MSLDDLARSATDSLLEGSTPDVGEALADLKRTRRRRATGRVVVAGLAAAVTVAGWAVVSDDSDGVEPAEPVVRNGALLVTTDRDFFVTVESGAGGSLDLPDDHFQYYAPGFTADGRELVYTSRDGRVVAHDVRTGDARTLWDCGRTSECFWSISPDGERLAVAVENGIEVHAPAEGTTELLPTPERPGAYLSWSPDGQGLAFSGPRGIYTVDLGSGGVRRVATLDDSRMHFPRVAWSPDGATIAFVESHLLEEPRTTHDVVEASYVLRLVDAEGGDARSIEDLGVCACLGLMSPDIAWAPDGTGIAFTKVGRIRSRGVHLLDLATWSTEQLTPDANGFLVWRPVPAG